MKQASKLDSLRRLLKFIREGWFWIILPAIILGTVLLLIAFFGDPYQKGSLHAKLILLYSLFGM